MVQASNWADEFDPISSCTFPSFHYSGSAGWNIPTVGFSFPCLGSHCHPFGSPRCSPCSPTDLYLSDRVGQNSL